MSSQDGQLARQCEDSVTRLYWDAQVRERLTRRPEGTREQGFLGKQPVAGQGCP